MVRATGGIGPSPLGDLSRHRPVRKQQFDDERGEGEAEHPPDQFFAMGHRGMHPASHRSNCSPRDQPGPPSSSSCDANTASATMVNTSTTNTLHVDPHQVEPPSLVRIGIRMNPTPIWMNPPCSRRPPSAGDRAAGSSPYRRHRLDLVLAGGHQDHTPTITRPARGRTIRPAGVRRATPSPSAPTAAAVARLRLSL